MNFCLILQPKRDQRYAVEINFLLYLANRSNNQLSLCIYDEEDRRTNTNVEISSRYVDGIF